MENFQGAPAQKSELSDLDTSLRKEQELDKKIEEKKAQIYN